jgi:hypothetical protein
MKKTIFVSGGIIVSLLVLIGTAYLVGQTLRASSSQEQALSDQPQLLEAGNQTGPQAVTINLIGSDELPDRQPDVMGFFSKREDNNLYVNESEDGAFMMVNQDGDITINAGDKETEIVVTNETVIYVDATLDDVDDSSLKGEYKQKVKPGSVEEIGDMSTVSAWGEKRGDRLVAEVLLYTRPPVITR